MEGERERERERESERAREKLVSIQLPHSPLGIIHTCSHIQSQAHFVLSEFCACHQQLAFRRVALFLCSFFFLLLTQSCRSETRCGGEGRQHRHCIRKLAKKTAKKRSQKGIGRDTTQRRQGNVSETAQKHAMERPHVRRIKPSCYIHGLSRRKKKGESGKERSKEKIKRKKEKE